MKTGDISCFFVGPSPANLVRFARLIDVGKLPDHQLASLADFPTKSVAWPQVLII